MKYLLPQVKRFYKACLHTHSTVSDGKLTPQQVRDAYKEKGYSIVALTDHSVTVEHQHLNQEDFLMLTGVEVDVDDRDYLQTGVREKVRHLCLISKDPYRLWIPFRDPEPKPSSVPYEASNEIGGLERDYSPEQFNAIIAECNRQGFLVTYNHPCWSLETYPDYAPMKGLWAMEYRNGGSVALGYDENNSRVYQDLLMLGNRLMPVFADDMHSVVRPNGFKVLGDSWVMIGAEKLDYASVIRAMERGELYGSCGPEIHSLTWDGQNIQLTCSPCASVQVVTQTRNAQLQLGDGLTQAEFDMTKWLKRSKVPEKAFFRLILTDEQGRYAATRAYWLDEL